MEKDKFVELLESTVLGVKYLLYIVFIFLEVDKDLINILLWLMIADTGSGLVKVFKINKSQLKFSILLWGLISKMAILIIPLIVALLFKGIGEDMGFGVVLIIKILMVSEFISIISNLYTIKTGITVKDIDIFTLMFKFLRCKALKLLSAYTQVDIKDDDCL